MVLILIIIMVSNLATLTQITSYQSMLVALNVKQGNSQSEQEGLNLPVSPHRQKRKNFFLKLSGQVAFKLIFYTAIRLAM